jgi:hypothetical protein
MINLILLGSEVEILIRNISRSLLLLYEMSNFQYSLKRRKFPYWPLEFKFLWRTIVEGDKIDVSILKVLSSIIVEKD